MNSFFIDVYKRPKSTMRKTYASIASPAISAQRRIHCILAAVAKAQIGQLIIRWVTIYMVDFPFTGVTIDKTPYNSMFTILPTINHHIRISQFIRPSFLNFFPSNIPMWRPIWLMSPGKQSSVSIIFEKFSENLLRWNWTGFRHAKKYNVILISSTLFLGGCAGGSSIGTVSGGECQLVHTPKYAVLGKTHYDRTWIVTTEEALVAGCNQPRPLVRPASFDAKPRARPIKKKVAKPAETRTRLKAIESVDGPIVPGAAPPPESATPPAPIASPTVPAPLPPPPPTARPKKHWWER